MLQPSVITSMKFFIFNETKQIKILFTNMRFESIDSLMYVMMITGSDIIFTLSVLILYLIDAAVLNF